jgi:hypothetical protein
VRQGKAMSSITDLEKRIEKLEARPLLYQRKDIFGNSNGLVYAKVQNALHQPVELDHIKNKTLTNEDEQ